MPKYKMTHHYILLPLNVVFIFYYFIVGSTKDRRCGGNNASKSGVGREGVMVIYDVISSSTQSYGIVTISLLKYKI